MRTYIAVYDDGHNFGDFEYCSDHRNGSKANLEDAKREAKRKYGFMRAKEISIVQTVLIGRIGE